MDIDEPRQKAEHHYPTDNPNKKQKRNHMHTPVISAEEAKNELIAVIKLLKGSPHMKMIVDNLDIVREYFNQTNEHTDTEK